MEKETPKKSSSPGQKLSDGLFRGIMYLLYGKKAGETMMEKAGRIGTIILVIGVLVVVYLSIKRAFFSQW